MGDEAHIGFVDAHTKGNGGAHDQAFLTQEAALVGGPLRRRQAGVVGQCGIALGRQPGGGFLHLLARQAVNNASLPAAVGEKGMQLAAGIIFLDHAVANVRAVEAGQEDACFAQAEAVQHLVACRLVGGGRQRNARYLGITLVQGGELQVFRAEIVPPLGYAMGLVNGEQGEFSCRVEGIEQSQGAFEHEALGSNVDQVELAAEHGLFDGLCVTPVECRVEDGGFDAELGQRIDLILHQGDQGGNDDGAAGAEQGRYLIAQTFAAPRWHEDQCVAALADVVDDFGLRAAKGGVAEDVAQEGEGSVHV